MRLSISLILGIFLSTSTLAHDFHELTVSRVLPGNLYIEVFLDNTVKGQNIVCAAYNKGDKLVGSNTWTTENLSTRVLVDYDRSTKPPYTAKCVLN